MAGRTVLRAVLLDKEQISGKVGEPELVVHDQYNTKEHLTRIGSAKCTSRRGPFLATVREIHNI